MASAEWGKKKKIAKLHEFSCTQLKTILDFTFNSRIKWLLPNTDFKYTPCDDSETTMRTRLYTECSKLSRFLNIGEYPNLKEGKRHQLFITLLETIHPKDAELLIHIVKNRELPGGKLTKEVVAEAFPHLSKNWN